MTSPGGRQQGWLLGHLAAETVLMADAAAGRLHHAWLLAGPAGIGKATLAFRFARWILAGQPGTSMALAETDPVFRRVATGTHADLLAIGPGFDEKRQRFRTEIVADDVRPVGDFLHRTAAEGGWRVVVLVDVELLNRHAANALLKVLEEPPPRCLMLLVSSVPALLLPTIRSRCRMLRMKPLALDDVAAVLRRLLPGTDAAEIDRLAVLGQGSPGRALGLAGADGLALEALVEEILAPGAGHSRTALLDRTIDLVLRREDGYPNFMELLAGSVSRRVRQDARAGIDPPAGGRDWIAVWQHLRQVRNETERFNLDKRQALLSSLSLLSEQ